ncbi:hypothetical protein O3M35_003635 [Rhynocoris fuscipes]|uniref:Uncharacterized protein n=1 Tax=Rhynocoris fuscipes TaxID=488301 RepID=A0AAW1CJJ3_9HEMI
MEETEDFETALQRMMNQLDLNELEIMKSKSTTLVVLKSFHKILLSMVNNYQKKMLQWETEVEKLRALNQKIELRIQKYTEEIHQEFYKTTDCLNLVKEEEMLKSDANFIKDNGINILKDLCEGKRFNYDSKRPSANLKLNNPQVNMLLEDNIDHQHECNPNNNDPYGFELDEELKKFPVLLSILEGKEESCGCLQNSRTQPNTSKFKICELSNEDLDPCNNNDIKNKTMEGNQLNFNKNLSRKRSTHKILEDSKFLELIKKLFMKNQCDNLEVSNSSSLLNRNGSKEQCDGKDEHKGRFSEPCDIKRKSQQDMSNTVVTNVSWYSGPNINKRNSSDCGNNNNIIDSEQLFEYKMRQKKCCPNPKNFCSNWRGFAAHWEKSIQGLYECRPSNSAQNPCDFDFNQLR